MLELPLFMGMHLGMDEEHVFAIDIKSNDPVEPVKTVRWRFVSKDLEWKSWLKEAVGTPTPTEEKGK